MPTRVPPFVSLQCSDARLFRNATLANLAPPVIANNNSVLDRVLLTVLGFNIISASVMIVSDLMRVGTVSLVPIIMFVITAVFVLAELVCYCF